MNKIHIINVVKKSSANAVMHCCYSVLHYCLVQELYC